MNDDSLSQGNVSQGSANQEATSNVSDSKASANKERARKKVLEVFEQIFQHDGFGHFTVEMKILKRQQKEIIIHFGKQYRFHVDYNNEPVQKSRELLDETV